MPTIPPSRRSRQAAAAIGLILVATGTFLVLKLPALPDLLPVHFTAKGAPDGWQFRTVPRVLMRLLV